MATTTVARLRDATVSGAVVASDVADLGFLEAAASLMAPGTLPRGFPPCLRCPCLVKAVDGQAIDVEVRCYATRMLFYLIADDSVKKVLNGLHARAGVRDGRRESPPSRSNEDMSFLSGHSSTRVEEEITRHTT